MHNLRLLKTFSKSRTSWVVLLVFTLFFNLSSIFFQHGMRLEPCTMCIYERITMMALCVVAVVGCIEPKSSVFRWGGIIGWGVLSYKGLTLSIEHIHYQTSIFATCDALYFPQWMPLNEWMPSLFSAPGDCSEVAWSFLSMSMPEWLILIFGAYLLVCGIVGVSQLVPEEKGKTTGYIR